MRGKHEINIMSTRINYKLSIKRKLTIISGDSGKGKTRLVMAIRDSKISKNVKVQCDVECIAITDDNWYSIISNSTGKIFFIDENHKCLDEGNFQRLLVESDNYFVVVTRRTFGSLPYSVKEIYTIVYDAPTKTNLLKPLYDLTMSVENIFPTVVLTEDRKAGHQFMKEYFKDIAICYSASGKSKIVSKLKSLNLTGEKILTFMDGAAFGDEINNYLLYIRSDKKNTHILYVPESFEFLILRSEGFYRHEDLKDKIDNPYNHVDPEHFSWEQYYTDLLTKITEGLSCSYNKLNLNVCYRKDCCFRDTSPCKFLLTGNKLKAICNLRKE